MLQPIIGGFFLLVYICYLTNNCEIDDKDHLPNNAAESKEKNIVYSPIYVSNNRNSHLYDTARCSVFNSRRF